MQKMEGEDAPWRRGDGDAHYGLGNGCGGHGIN